MEYVEYGVRAGLDIDDFAPRLSFFFNSHNDLFEEVAKFRAARRVWAKVMRDRYGAKDPRSWQLRFHTQTAGCSLTAQQPYNNIVRVTIQALAAVFGGTQSLHTNSLDEAFAIPSEEAIKIAVRTQQIVLEETGAADVVDPLGGSYYVESLTARIEEEALSLIERIDHMGGMTEAIRSGFANQLIADSAWEQQQRIEDGTRRVIGLNAYTDDDRSVGGIELFRSDPGVRDRQVERLSSVKRSRDGRRVAEALRAIEREAPALDTNLMPFIEEAVRARATVGEICDVLRQVWGEHPPSSVF
jgi:methylmalonyl-CoA mutase N-terminal domain/subunit